eukprot:TRINITY_DN4503_c0_g1_i1.p1 TRINITY_DN4503_c0_g1~~TRINITY_DN4503_c0_g1_i1.p1  ORF type:complete len:117 (-),score=18.70 TRINITY_DN4503_c0_g1_i1:524-874(-)
MLEMAAVPQRAPRIKAMLFKEQVCHFNNHNFNSKSHVWVHAIAAVPQQRRASKPCSLRSRCITSRAPASIINFNAWGTACDDVELFAAAVEHDSLGASPRPSVRGDTHTPPPQSIL